MAKGTVCAGVELFVSENVEYEPLSLFIQVNLKNFKIFLFWSVWIFSCLLGQNIT